MSSVPPPQSQGPDSQSVPETTVSFDTFSAESPLPETTLAFDTGFSEVPEVTHYPAVVNYEAREEVGRGGMAKIFSADDPLLNRLVAIKVSTADVNIPDTLFLKEAEVLANLAHPNIPPIHSRGTDDQGRAFYSMKLIRGQTLQKIIKQLASGNPETAATFTLQRLLEIFRKVCDAVALAHAKGYLHRDLKPENIMVGEFGEVLVMDWGLAVEFGETTQRPAPLGAPGEAQQAGTIRLQGTPQYMSPEQVEGMVKGLDERSDIYSLGGVLYAILTSNSPFSGNSLDEVLDRVRHGKITPMPRSRAVTGAAGPAESLIPEALRAVTFKALATHRSGRYPNVSNLIADIEAYQNGFATSAEQAGLVRQLTLLIKRNRLASCLAAILLVVAAGFTVRLAQSEKLSRLRASEAQQSAEQALLEKKAARRSAADAQLAMAEIAERELNTSEVRRSLQAVPEELREHNWHYLDDRLNVGVTSVQAKGDAAWSAVEPVLQKAGFFFTLEKDGWIRSVDLNTGAIADLLKVKTQDLSSELGVSPDGSLVIVTRLIPKARNAPQNTPQMAIFEGYDVAQKQLKYSGQFVHDRFIYVFNASGTVWGLRCVRSGIFSARDATSGAVLWEKNGLSYHYVTAVQSEDAFNLFSSLRKNNMLVDSRTGADKAPVRAFEYPDTIPGHAGVITVSPSGAEAFVPSKEGLALADTVSVLRKTKFTILPPPGKAGPRGFEADWNNRLLFCAFRKGERDGLLQVHASQDGKKLLTLGFSIPNTITDLRLLTHPQSKHVVVVSSKYMKAWKIEAASGFKRLETAPRDPNALTHSFCFGESSDVGIAYLAKTKDGNLTLEDLIKPEEKDAPQSNFYQINPDVPPTIVSSVDGKTVAIANVAVRTAKGAPYEFQIFKAKDGTYSRVARREGKVSGKGFQLSPSGKYLWIGRDFFEADTLTLLKYLDHTGFTVVDETASTRWVGDEHFVEIATQQTAQSEEYQEIFSRVLLLWSKDGGKPVATATAPYAAAVSGSPDGSRLAEGGGDFRVRVRDGKTLETIREFRVHDAPLTAIAWHPLLPIVATASEDHSVKIWDLRTEKMLQKFALFINAPTGLYWSPDGKRLAVQHADTASLIDIFNVDCVR